ncbi:ATP-dependent nuclease [Paenibacillus sp. PL91]|uniref:ATP-dependent nuclease n=1 Tax=Paenibacillus sp. PL91 TaxID=2729538 RepID=UPI00145F7B03|nr:AAA family ATPase [Paenibacillus sp. PL91]MBC9199797.1 AAA family ATPase [Paenibacillus sp. PL91]
MLITKLTVKGLRSLTSVSLRFEEFSVIVGKNDIGKSSTLRALDIFLNDLKPNRNEISHGENKLEISITFKLTSEELENEEFHELVKPYLDSDRFEVKKTISIDTADVTKLRTAEVYIKDEKIKPADWKKLSFHLPQFIYVESIRDIDKATKLTSGSILGKLVMPLVLKKKEVTNGIQQLKTIISDNISSIVTDIEGYLKEQTADVLNLIPKSDITMDKAIELDLLVNDGFSTTSISGKGSGIQSSLVVSLFRAYAKHHVGKNLIFGIEEPDAYLHVGAQRKIFHSLQSITENEGQVVLTTHSTVFIDRGNLKGITLLKRNEQGKVEAKRIKQDRDISIIQENLELRNSDWLQWDAILMVEGGTEDAVLDIWAKKLGINLDSIGIKILVIGGKDKALYFANATILDDLGIPYAVLLDSDEKNPNEYAEYLIKQTKIKRESCFILDKREIENYYPKHVLQKVFPEKDFESVNFGDKDDVKDQLLKIVNKSPESLGRIVASSMMPTEIPFAIQEAIQHLIDKILHEDGKLSLIQRLAAATNEQ